MLSLLAPEAGWRRPVAVLALLLTLAAMLPTAIAAPKILVLGDSLSAGYGIAHQSAWPTLLQQRLGGEYSVVNASISGETTAGGRSRLPEQLARHRPTLVVIALGANDGLRGLPLTQMRDNLVAMIGATRSAGASPLLIGVRLPPNFGAYADAFHRSFSDIAQAQRVPLVPFLLDGFADRPEFFQEDGLHPTAAAQPLILDNVWPQLSTLLQRSRK
jgi:acyl-CoA thioesterase-1